MSWATRDARRVYVAGSPINANIERTFSLTPFQSMLQSATRHARHVYLAGFPINANIEKFVEFAFMEMRTVEEVTNAMALDGILLMVLN
ncbi:hypothetical protein H6P81_017648 [Aristolochia fimbriata]|uniref:RRM domain-containing protein n=1 Tax=Aristolochia fimbriata TaxID=158543 RepID=A0AAV7DZS9_ARIFI|nr:hypothetical protein H6P81_017648 [Aristolochia fimbriata]